jgi:hypothetical protein
VKRYLCSWARLAAFGGHFCGSQRRIYYSDLLAAGVTGRTGLVRQSQGE